MSSNTYFLCTIPVVTTATGTANELDQAEPYRMFDGLGGAGDNGVDSEGVMTLDVSRCG